MLECMEILAVAVEKGVRVYAVKGNWSLDSSIQSKIVAMAFSMAWEIEALMQNGSTQKFIAWRYGTTEANLHNWIKKNNLKRKDL